MSKTVRGRCHCGAIRYQVNGELTGVIHCHCSDCRRWHGHFAAYAVANLADFEITEGADKLKWYESSEKARRGFCPDLRLAGQKTGLPARRPAPPGFQYPHGMGEATRRELVWRL